MENELFLKAIKHKRILGVQQAAQSAFHIGYGIDDAYARCMAASIASICRHNPEKQITFHILASHLSESTMQMIAQLADAFSIEIRIYSIDVSAFNCLPTQVHFPASIYYRYMLPLILDVAKVLYMDADIICLGSLQELFDLPLHDKVAAAVPDVEWMNQKRNKALNLKNHRYFNSGVLLLDIPKWNEQNILGQVITALMSNPQKFRYPDQDALNLILTDKVYYLADKWNHLNAVTADQQESILLHFAAHPKPWSIAWPLSKVCNGFTKDIYKQYEALTPWRGYPLLLPNNYKEMKIYAECLLSQGEYIKGLNWYLRYIKTKLSG